MFEHWKNNKDITYRRHSRFCRRTNVRTLAGETIKFPADYQPLISAQRGPGCVKSKVLCGFGGRINRQTRQLILNQSARNCHQTRPLLRAWALNFHWNHLEMIVSMSIYVTVLKERGVLVLAPTRRDKFPLTRTFLLVKAVSLFSDTAFHVVPWPSLYSTRPSGTSAEIPGRLVQVTSRGREDTKACFPFPAQDRAATGASLFAWEFTLGSLFPQRGFFLPGLAWWQNRGSRLGLF